jgi:hypothetical protein
VFVLDDSAAGQPIDNTVQTPYIARLFLGRCKHDKTAEQIRLFRSEAVTKTTEKTLSGAKLEGSKLRQTEKYGGVFGTVR